MKLSFGMIRAYSGFTELNSLVLTRQIDRHVLPWRSQQFIKRLGKQFVYELRRSRCRGPPAGGGQSKLPSCIKLFAAYIYIHYTCTGYDVAEANVVAAAALSPYPENLFPQLSFAPYIFGNRKLSRSHPLASFTFTSTLKFTSPSRIYLSFTAPLRRLL